MITHLGVHRVNVYRTWDCIRRTFSLGLALVSDSASS